MTDSTPERHLPIADRRQVRRAALGAVRADTVNFAIMLAINCAAAAAGLAAPWLVGRIIDDIQDEAGESAVTWLAVAILGFAIAQLVLTRFANYLGSRFGERAQARIREQFVDRVLSLPPAVVERAGIGDLIARGTGDVAAIGNTLRDAGPAMLIATLQIVFIVGAVLIINPLLGLCGLAGLLGIQFVGRWYLRTAREGYLAQGAAGSLLAEQLAASAAGARTIEALSLQQQRRDACDQAIARFERAQHDTLYLRSILYPSVDVSCVIPVVLVLLAGLALYDNGKLSLGAAVAVALYMLQLAQPIATMLIWVEQIQSSGASFARVEGVGLTARDSRQDASRLEPANDRIEASNVSYSYDGEHDVLSEVSLTIQPGERLALVGLSGAGKTTLARLLAGGDRPRTGSVTVGQVPIADLPAAQLRRQVQFVTQEQHLFLGTLADNLRLAKPAADDPELRRAMHVVGADWVDELPDGVNTLLGGNAFSLGAAQVQQIALGRIVLADPHTLVLDEATSLLDPSAARRTERALAALLRGRTIVTVAHRLETARDANRVAIMDSGRIVEIGTHAQLLHQNGAYAALWRAWEGHDPAPEETKSGTDQTTSAAHE